jgi:parallel beta-helix repeat protein
MSNTVSGNYIGVDATGAADLGNNGNGIDISEGRNNIIGGATSGERNVISGNDQRGIIISGADATGNTVLGNYIGTDASGSTDLGNTWSGVEIRSGAHHNLVGGSTPNERNIISGNDQDGVYIYSSDTTTNTISGNYIGLAANGTSSMGNTGYGVYISRSKFNVVGPNNVVAHNGDDGIFVVRSEAISNTITQNSIFSNTMGIRLWQSANGGIAAPVIITTIQGSVNIGGTACAGCTVEVFENSDTDGEGETYVGDTIADASGNFTVTVSALTQPYLTATATDVISGTSEFSDVFTVTVELAPGSGTIFLPIVLKNY